jgi:hypothetical protein
MVQRAGGYLDFGHGVRRRYRTLFCNEYLQRQLMSADRQDRISGRNTRSRNVLGAIGLILGFASWGLWLHYSYSNPQSPDVATGRTYSLNTHGSMVYLNFGERVVLYGLQAAAGLSFASAVVIDVVRRKQY